MQWLPPGARLLSARTMGEETRAFPGQGLNSAAFPPGITAGIESILD